MKPRPLIAMTTNGVGLDRLAAPLARAGLDRVNVSLDTIDQQEFFRLTRRDRLVDVEKGLKAAASAGLTPVKVNAVAMRGINDHSAADVLQWCLDRGYQLRFIEQMPLDAQHEWQRDQMVTADEIRQAAVHPVHADGAAGRGQGQCARGAVPRGRRTGDGRDHRQRVRPILCGL
jgi:cyclic pyranopterin phosphate synthase